MMKFIVVTTLSLLCLVGAAISAPGEPYELDPRQILKYTSELHRFLTGINSKVAVFLLADLYHYVNNASVTQEMNQENIDVYLAMFDNFAHWIVKNQKNPQIYVQTLYTSRKYTDFPIDHMIDRTRQTLWNASLDQSETLDERIELLFMREIIALFNDGHVEHSATLIKALEDGSGLCTVFKYPNHDDLTDGNTRFTKIAYLLQEFARRNLDVLLANQSSQVLAVQKLDTFCKKLGERKLDFDKSKALFYGLLKKKLDKPISELEPYTVGSSHDICSDLMQNDKYLNTVYKNFYSLGAAFLFDCLDQLADRLSRALQQQQQRAQMFQETVSSHWFAIAVSRQIGRKKKASHTRYMLELAKRWPEVKTMLLDRNGNSLCDMVETEEFSAIGRQFEYVDGKIGWLEIKKLLSSKDKMKNLYRFSLLRGICMDYHENVPFKCRIHPDI